MYQRPYWLDRIFQAWKKRPVVWLSGVRRVGKTTLARMLPKAVYMNCDLPSTERTLLDPESFLDSLSAGAIVVFDEIHQLKDPSRLLKIAADNYPELKVLATGSSTLAATSKFRDTLTGRKYAIYLPPVLWTECISDFKLLDLDRRLLRGGLPEPLLAVEKDNEFYSEWMDSFYARDIQELYGIRNRSGFLHLLQLLLIQSGGMLDYTRLSQKIDMSRPTIKAHVEAMTTAHAVFLIPPFHGRAGREIVKRPKVYAFDTGFVTFTRGWTSIREEDRAILWEHLVLDALRASTGTKELYFWRDKSGREIDFILKQTANRVDAIEAKINPDDFETDALQVFRSHYPSGNNYVISPRVKIPFQRKFGSLVVLFHSLESLPFF